MVETTIRETLGLLASQIFVDSAVNSFEGFAARIKHLHESGYPISCVSAFHLSQVLCEAALHKSQLHDCRTTKSTVGVYVADDNDVSRLLESGGFGKHVLQRDEIYIPINQFAGRIETVTSGYTGRNRYLRITKQDQLT